MIENIMKELNSETSSLCLMNESLKKHPQRVMVFENKDIID